MGKEKEFRRRLREKMGIREGGIGEYEMRLLEAAVSAYRETVDSGRTSQNEVLPTRYVAVGDRIRRRGRVYECVVAGRVSRPADACSGCDMKGDNIRCYRLQCSPFDRKDGLFTWFKEVK